MNPLVSLNDARRLLLDGGVLAYPTEAVYGLGCDPFNQQAVERILALKQRSVDQGLIVLIHDWAQLDSLIVSVPKARFTAVQATWPGPTTWVFPKAKLIPHWLSGAHDTLAIRMSAHPVARALCRHAPLVSTSANMTGREPARDYQTLLTQFPEGLDGIVAGELGSSALPSAIIDALSGQRIR